MAPSLRVALLAGSLTKGGAEKQLVYMAQALRQRGVAVRVYSLTRGEFYEGALTDLDLAPEWIGSRQSPLVRSLALAQSLRPFRPHIVQAGHFFTNLHVTLAARLVAAQAIGSLRNDAVFEVEANGRWGRWLLRVPPAVVANSTAARRNAVALGGDASKIHLVPNVLNVEEFDRRTAGPETARSGFVAVTVSRLVAAKRLDRFLEAVSIARRQVTDLRALVIGDGPERAFLEGRARELQLLPDTVTFLGQRHDIPELLRQAHVAVVSSDHEGFPNVVLEAMAARLPVVTTPAGDAATIVEDGTTGFVVPFDDTAAMADRIVRLAQQNELRVRMGAAARARIECRYSERHLADSLFSAYHAIAVQCRNKSLLAALSN
jgi:glycosyltransferase involved in cell wall biosynthesis